jgi:CRP-like cAMP-binding protein
MLLNQHSVLFSMILQQLPYFERFNKEAGLTQVDFDLLKQCVETTLYPRNSLVVCQGKETHHIYFILTGLVRGYYSVGKKEYTDSLWTENDFFGDTLSFLGTTNLASVNCQTLEPTRCLCIDAGKLDVLSAISARLTYWMYLLMSDGLHEDYYSTHLLRYCSVPEKVAYITAQRPTLFSRCSSSLIASYLDMRPETLSRISRR